MRLALATTLLCLLTLGVGCDSDDEDVDPATTTEPAPEGTARAQLEVDVDLETERDRFTVLCTEEGDPGEPRLCENLDALLEIARVDRADQVCTQIYGGPETARLRGTVLGDQLDLRLSRENGCRIAEWQTVFGLLGKPYAGGEPGTTPPEPID